MEVIEHIINPVRGQFEAYEMSLQKSFASTSSQVSEYMDYVRANKGKQLRPLLVLLSAGMFGTPSEKVVEAAVAVELLHNTSLIHDDVVDNADLRRSHDTINHTFGNKSAVLVGDYLFALVVKKLSSIGDLKIIEWVSEVSEQMSAGEILQQKVSRKQLLDIENYFDVIEKKTALLMSLCCQIGAYLSGADAVMQQAVVDFGRNIGIAFQIQDDILDYIGPETGKPLFNDIREHKPTLPFIYTIQHLEESEKERMTTIFFDENQSRDDVECIARIVSESGGINHAKEEVEKYYEKACQSLDLLPDNPCRTALRLMAEFITVRKN